MCQERDLKIRQSLFYDKEKWVTKGEAYNEALGEAIEMENSIGQAEMELLDIELE
jgi:hypothetical protein